jgi:hypothetical protein
VITITRTQEPLSLVGFELPGAEESSGAFASTLSAFKEDN